MLMLRRVCVVGLLLSLVACAGWDRDRIYDPVTCTVSGMFCGWSP